MIDAEELADDVASLMEKLQSVIDFKAVATDVAEYNHESLRLWVSTTENWQQEMGNKDLRWYDSWRQDPDGAVAAVEEFLSKPAEVRACRSQTVWPPPSNLVV